MRSLPPPITATATASVRTKVHRVLRSIIDLGIADGTLRPDVTPHDIVVFGAIIAQPRPTDPDWDTTCRRLLATYLRGIAV